MAGNHHTGQDEIPRTSSKSSRKREMTAAQELGRSLLELKPRQLAALDLPAELLSALNEYRRLPNSHEAKRRQLQFIGKIMRGLDHHAVGEALERLSKPDPEEIRRGRCIEQWAAFLLSDDARTDPIGEFLETHPAADRQAVRQLLRSNGHGDVDSGRSRRRLRDYLKKHVSTASPEPSGPDS